LQNKYIANMSKKPRTTFDVLVEIPKG